MKHLRKAEIFLVRESRLLLKAETEKELIDFLIKDKEPKTIQVLGFRKDRFDEFTGSDFLKAWIWMGGRDNPEPGE